MNSFHARGLRLLLAALLLAPLAGCIGMYSNTELFLNDPAVGTSESDLLASYGAPSFVADTGDERIYAYKVRETKYIILAGIYSGYDLIVSVKGGAVTKTNRVKRPAAMTLLQPLPWAVAD